MKTSGLVPALAANSRSIRKVPRIHNVEMRKWRCRIKNFFPKIREFLEIATRCDKTIVSFCAFGIWRRAVIAADSFG